MSWPARLMTAFVYLAMAAAWLRPVTATHWLAALQYVLAAGHLLAATGWLLQFSRRRLPQLCAWLPLLGLPLAIAVLVADPGLVSLALLASSPLLFLLSGWVSYQRETDIAGLPVRELKWSLALKIALDEAMLGYFVSTTRTPARRRVPEIANEVLRAIDAFGRQGWLDNPAAFHQTVHSPQVFELEDRLAIGHPFKSLSFPSSYVSHSELPGAERWETYGATHTVHARIFEHEGGPRPWLMCVHGYRMGWPYIDFQLFSPGWLHHKLGFNLIMPLLPLHGLRKIGMRSGDGYFDGELLDLLHAEAQALTDLRSCLLWLREQRQVPRMGIYGISLGGLNASLLSCLDAEIDSLIAGIPLVDPLRVFELNAPTRLMRGLQQAGVGIEQVRALLAPISPLSMECRVPLAGRAIVAGMHDKIVSLEPILALQAHWNDCPLHWYAGTHLSVRRERDVRAWLRSTWKAHGMIDAEGYENMAVQ